MSIYQILPDAHRVPATAQIGFDLLPIHGTGAVRDFYELAGEDSCADKPVINQSGAFASDFSPHWLGGRITIPALRG